MIGCNSAMSDMSHENRQFRMTFNPGVLGYVFAWNREIKDVFLEEIGGI